ncbi:MAG: hypothetical protein Q9225_003217 [Loekoesia sp. 1 TL-2023]
MATTIFKREEIGFFSKEPCLCTPRFSDQKVNVPSIQEYPSPCSITSESLGGSPNTKRTDSRALAERALRIAKGTGYLGKLTGEAYDSSQIVRGVSISCNAQIIRWATPRFTVFESPRRDFLGQVPAPDISVRIQLPLTISITNFDTTNTHCANHYAEELFRVGDTKSADWGMKPPAGQNPGNVLVFRRDGKELLPQHVEALVTWIPTLFAGQMFGRPRQWMQALYPDHEERLKERFEALATKKAFESFWKWWKGLNQSWEDVPSPYEM